MSFKNKNVLVTGGAGFIGCEVVRQLVDQGARVVVVDNLVNGRRENLDFLPNPLCRLVVADIRDKETIEKLLAGVDIVFHLACLGVRHSIHSPLENHEVNATATLGLLAAARAKGVQRFVYVSSSEVYGTAVRVPIDEEHPTLPRTVYGASKLAGECYARAFYGTYHYATVVVRPFNAFGPRSHHEGDSGEVIPKFLLRVLAGKPMVIFGDGTQTRDFTYVSDTAGGILAAGDSESAVGRTINIGSGREISIQDLAGEVARTAGRPDAETVKDNPRPGDVLRLCADVSEARELLGFKPKEDLRSGLEKLLAWYRGLKKSPEELLEEEILYNWETAKASLS